MQCPLCGLEVTELSGGLCDQCASERKPFLDAPDVLDVTRCAHCARLQRGGAWDATPGDRDGAVGLAMADATAMDADLASPSVRTDLRWEDERNGTATVVATGTYRGHPVERHAEVRVRLKASACPDCSRRYGGYFEAIVQIRASDERILRAEADRAMARIVEDLETRRAEGRTGAWVTKSDRVRGGFDLYVGGLEVARLIAHGLADRYGAEYAESGKLVGRRDGRDLYRFTLLVRFPPYLPGDFILFDDRPYKVLRHERKQLTLWDLERFQRVQREPRLARRLKVIGRAEDERDAVVVSYRGGNLQILDPVTLKTLDLRVPDDVDGRETVRVFRHEDRVFVLPPPPTVAQGRAV